MRPRTSGRSTIARAVPAYYMVKVLLAVFVGAAAGAPERRGRGAAAVIVLAAVARRAAADLCSASP